MKYGRSRSEWSWSAFLAVCSLALACGDDDRAPARDAGTARDASVLDTGGGDDAGEIDAGPPDAGGPAYADPAATSGSRLSRRFLAASDGASMTVDFWDTELEIACKFRTAADGALRCLPVDAQDVHFSDPGCTQPVYETPTSACDTGWATQWTDETMYRRTTMPAVLTGLIYYRSPTACEALALPLDGEYWVAEQVPSASFVRGTRVDESRTDGMVARFIEGEDGSRILDETVHGTRGYECAFDDDGYCVIPPETIGVYYLDPTCTERIHPQYVELPPPPMLTDRILDSRRCLTDVRYYERGAIVTATTIYVRDSMTGVCTSRAHGTAHNFYRRGAEIPVASLPRATISNEGAGPLQARRWVDGSGAPLGVAHTLWDASRDEDCMPVQRDDGSLTCVPRAFAIVPGSHFADAACSDTMQIAESYCHVSAPRLLVDFDFASCRDPYSIPAMSAVFERGAEVGPDYWFANESVSCQMRTFSDSSTGYRLGADADSSLPSVELRIE